ncbi:RNA polymerase sigma factor [Candidatus Formimonas warabiya]|nr:sigma-70 family RNA polymerase sigma factor [Candidatus Formimonas warabiya]
MDFEEQLIRQILTGEEEAFRLLVEKYKAYVFAVIFSFVQEKDQAENVAQEVFLQVFRSLPQYRFHSFKSWIGKIAVRKAIDWRRARVRLSREEFSGDPGTAGERVWALTPSPEDIFFQKEQEARVRKVCGRLPEIYGNVLIKFYFQEKSYQEIAKEEGTTVKTVESRLYRARILFRKKWEEGA